MAETALTFLTVTGAEIRLFTEDAARLRIAVFRDFPYLYDGDMEYEKRYLQTYSDAPDSLFVIARDGERVVGVSTGVPLARETGEVLTPFLEAGIPPEEVFYFGESVLLPEYRGRGAGVRFFEERENYARGLSGIRRAVFCAVDRAADHPRRPVDFTPLDEFWKKRGFTQTDIHTQFSWREPDEAEESPKRLTFWMKAFQI